MTRIFDLASHISNHLRAANGEHPSTDDDPQWLFHFLDSQSQGSNRGARAADFKRACSDGRAMVLLDGLDEAPDERWRETIVRLVERFVTAYAGCTVVVTSRPRGYEGSAVLSGDRFRRVDIAPFDDDDVRQFLTRWSSALHPQSPESARTYAAQLWTEVSARHEIRRMASNPVMLTALAIVHWNERKMPEQRAALYESVIGWLLSARKRRPGRATDKVCKERLQRLALAMQTNPHGRRDVERGWAAGAIAVGEPGMTQAQALEFLETEEIDSGIVMRRGKMVEFWHLTFLEYLAARAINEMKEEKQQALLIAERRLKDPQWREVVLLFAGVLFEQGSGKVNAFLSKVLDEADAVVKSVPAQQRLSEEARCFGLMGAMVADLEADKYQPGDERYERLRERVMGIFDAENAAKIDLAVRLDAAEALGQGGDHRLEHDNWVEIPGGTFVMGEQKDREKPNYDPEAEDRESPVHEVHLDKYSLARYPVTVREFGRFVEDGGYGDPDYWPADVYGKWKEPGEWAEQIAHPNRPVVGVSWYEAMAFCQWKGVSLPTEAQWERAARGPERQDRIYPWGGEEPDLTRANFDKTKIGSASPVGLFPAGNVAWDKQEGLWLTDMAGNVWEWCGDWFGAYSEDKQESPMGPESGECRVVRGGSWRHYPRYLRCAYRNSFHPDYRCDRVGFRVVSVPRYDA